jgi:hypothetical protein
MSRSLPPQPNLEHLKKQAKDRLRELKQQHPAAQLADAQHSLAREYGFASWPKLKAHVEGQAAAHPLAGRWTADLARSTRHPANPFQSAALLIEVAGNSVTIQDTVVDAAGREESNRSTILADGVERASPPGNGYALSARWLGPRVLETLAKKDGRPAGRGRYEVSEDGRRLTITGDEQVIVLVRA